MDFYSFKNQCARMVVIDFAHHNNNNDFKCENHYPLISYFHKRTNCVNKKKISFLKKKIIHSYFYSLLSNYCNYEF